ncbi:MAG TPA: sensor histidine kinase [Solirubrobacteraceae bacterium]|nr:sensor histidine kinase [Solirubrobacteraceae bacterium]
MSESAVLSTGVQSVIDPIDPARAGWRQTQRRWLAGRRRVLLAATFLVYLTFTGVDVARLHRGVDAVAGYTVLGAFAVVYLTMVATAPRLSPRSWWTLVSVMVALLCAELPFARSGAFVMCLYITAVLVMRLGARAAPAVLAMTLAALLVPALVGSWHQTVGDAFGDVTPVAIPIVGLAAFAVLQIVNGNEALASARVELERLGAENERNRIARDLHDLLGHSLTTITVKAGLAHRIGAADPGRALKEMAEVEALARRSLADVRAAVSDYREVTLTRELATAREVLRAAGVTADFPGAVDVVAPANHELFGWIVREGVTNVVRHAHAGVCSVRLTATTIELRDDGVGGDAATQGNGLRGLRERVASAGGTVQAGPLQPHGWRLLVSVPAGARP